MKQLVLEYAKDWITNFYIKYKNETEEELHNNILVKDDNVCDLQKSTIMRRNYDLIYFALKYLKKWKKGKEGIKRTVIGIAKKLYRSW